MGGGGGRGRRLRLGRVALRRRRGVGRLGRRRLRALAGLRRLRLRGLGGRRGSGQIRNARAFASGIVNAVAWSAGRFQQSHSAARKVRQKSQNAAAVQTSSSEVHSPLFCA